MLYSMVILVIDLVCFVFISCSYIYIYMTSMLSARTSGQTSRTSATSKRNRKLQQKVSIIIATDFICWVPFVILCWLHFTGTVNGAPYYPLFSVVILPINSVINPLLYSNVITTNSKDAIKKVISGSTRIFREKTSSATKSSYATTNSSDTKTFSSNRSTHFFNTQNSQEQKTLEAVTETAT